MSVVVTVAAVGSVAVASKVFAGMAAAAAAGLGMKAAEAAGRVEEEERRHGLLQDEVDQLRTEAERIDVSVATEAALEQAVAERCSLSFADDRVQLTVTRDIRGKVTVRAHGDGISRAELTERANRFLGLIQQQVAYRQVVTEMKRHGFAVAEEERTEDGTVRVRIKRNRR